MFKTSTERLNDTLAYIKDRVSGGQALEVATSLSKQSATQKTALSELLSLKESSSDGKSQRRAVRANVLISQLFIETEFWRGIAVTDISMGVLKNASEVQLISRLKSWWADPTVNEAGVCQAAREAVGTMPNWGNNPCDPAHIAGRPAPYLRPLNCFSGVMYWAYLSGAVSLRWLWNVWSDLEGNDANGIKRNGVMGFGSAKVWEKSAMVEGKYLVPAGHTVQFVNRQGGRGSAFGHVVLSLGNGRCMSQNFCAGFRPNAVDGGVPPEDQLAVIGMKAGQVHDVSLRTLREGFYSQEEGYHTMHSAAPFWLGGLH